MKLTINTRYNDADLVPSEAFTQKEESGSYWAGDA